MGVSTTLRLDIEVPEDYVQGFQQAENTFLYQLVFDPTTRKLLPLTPYPEDINVEDIPYAGSYKQEELALGMALGNIDIHTLKVVDNFDPMNANSVLYKVIVLLIKQNRNASQNNEHYI